jgi:hypothetical protein
MNIWDNPTLHLDTNQNEDCLSTFHSHSRIFNNERNSYPFDEFFLVVEWIVLSAFSNMLTKFLQSMAKYYLNGLHLKHQILFKNEYFFLKI